MSQIAYTILDQLGGNKFVAMTGAKNLMSDTNALCFRLPSHFAKDGINYIKISLESTDTYCIEAGTVQGRNYTKQSETEMVPVENLRQVFTGLTGLDCSL